MSKKDKESFSSEDVKFMRAALALAKRGIGRTSPNPAVGAVIVKDGKIIGRGYHKKAGGPHAEIEAIRSLRGANINDSVMYVTLEPCCHTAKRTPPCTKALIECGLRQIVVAMRDPNRMVSGKGIKELKQSGFSVREGLLFEEAKNLNFVYIRNQGSRLPFTVLKMALSLDGKIAGKSGERLHLSCAESQKIVHGQRNTYDGILTTSATVSADDPHLGVRYVKGRDPLRIILDRFLKTDVNAMVYRDENVIVFTTTAAGRRNIVRFGEKGIRMKIFRSWPPLKTIFEILWKMGVNSLLIESGSKMAKSLIKEKLVNKCIFFISPDIIGSRGLSVFKNGGDKRLIRLPKMDRTTFFYSGRDLVIEGYM